MAGGGGNSDEEIISAINVTPLVDVVLVLLIILMVTAQYVAEKDSIPMELPKGATGESLSVRFEPSAAPPNDLFANAQVETGVRKLEIRARGARERDQLVVLRERLTGNHGIGGSAHTDTSGAHTVGLEDVVE